MDATSRGPTLYEFLMEAELSHYYNSVKTDLKVNNVSQLKYVEEEDLTQLGMSKPEQRRLRKFFHKYYPQTYLKKIKKMILPKFKEDMENTSILLVDSTMDKNVVRVPSKHIISADNIIINKELGVGEFGVVEQGVWTNEEGERIQVAIKCLSKERIQNNHMEFLKEAAIMHTIDHEHIVRLYGVVLDTKALMLVTELAPLRSLLECLKEPTLRPSFPVISLCDFAIQICDGMQYLESKRLIHRDLAARNILVFAKNKVKISDFGLSRALGVGKDYYQTNFNVNLKLPIAWCAPECINYLRFTTSSDVWAYGVTLWEMFSYGFQPWAALTGQQILEAIDDPNFQRLEQPECCPKEYYILMRKCWQHDPNKRPKFTDILNFLPECKPEQVQAVKDYISFPGSLKIKDWLVYKVGDVITVLDKRPSVDNPHSWKGVLNNGKTGLFNPTNTVAYLGQNLPTNRPSFSRADGKAGIYSSRRRLCPEMISRPQGDLKHTGHIGLDGAFFGDVSFLGDKYQQLPRQVVTPYKPQEDKEQNVNSLLRNTSEISDRTPLLTKPVSVKENKSSLSTETWSDIKQEENIINNEQVIAKTDVAFPKPQENFQSEVPLPTRREKPEIHNENFESCANDLKNKCDETSTTDVKRKSKQTEPLKYGPDHEYHEISDEEIVTSIESPRFEMLDFGPSLVDEVFKALETNRSELDLDEQQYSENNNNVRNEIKEITSKLIGREGSRKKQAMVKPISATDQQTLDSAIAMAKELASKSMLELDYKSDSDVALESPKTPTSPTKRKFSFKFKTSPKPERRNFTEETESIPDINDIISKEAKEAYNSLVDKGQGLERSISHPATSYGSSCQISSQHHNSAQSNTDLSDPESLNSNPLRMLRLGGPVRPKVRGNKHNIGNLRIPASASNTHRDENHSSSSAIVSTSSNGTESNCQQEKRRTERKLCHSTTNCTNNQTDNKSCDSNNAENVNEGHQNPLPLPPRDRTRPPPVLKYHHRKYPLVIPANTDGNEDTIKHVSNVENIHEESTKQCSASDVDEGISLNDDIENSQKSEESQNELHNHVTDEECIPPPKPARTCSLNDSFESQIQAEVDSLDDIPEENPPSPPMYNSSDHVSCEDLLEFAMDKPNSKRTQGRARGIDSDEVRIMQKVLAKEQITPKDCLFALNETDWNIHKAIKFARLLRILHLYDIDTENSKSILSQCDWNVQQAASRILEDHGNIEDTTEV